MAHILRFCTRSGHNRKSQFVGKRQTLPIIIFQKPYVSTKPIPTVITVPIVLDMHKCKTLQHKTQFCTFSSTTVVEDGAYSI